MTTDQIHDFMWPYAQVLSAVNNGLFREVLLMVQTHKRYDIHSVVSAQPHKARLTLKLPK
jgi:hypothetical protein